MLVESQGYLGVFGSSRLLCFVYMLCLLGCYSNPVDTFYLALLSFHTIQGGSMERIKDSITSCRGRGLNAPR